MEDYYLCIYSLVWGKGKSITEAIRNCQKEASRRRIKFDRTNLGLYYSTDPGISITEDGTIRYRKDASLIELTYIKTN